MTTPYMSQIVNYYNTCSPLLTLEIVHFLEVSTTRYYYFWRMRQWRRGKSALIAAVMVAVPSPSPIRVSAVLASEQAMHMDTHWHLLKLVSDAKKRANARLQLGGGTATRI